MRRFCGKTAVLDSVSKYPIKYGCFNWMKNKSVLLCIEFLVETRNSFTSCRLCFIWRSSRLQRHQRHQRCRSRSLHIVLEIRFWKVSILLSKFRKKNLPSRNSRQNTQFHPSDGTQNPSGNLSDNAFSVRSNGANTRPVLRRLRHFREAVEREAVFHPLVYPELNWQPAKIWTDKFLADFHFQCKSLHL